MSRFLDHIVSAGRTELASSLSSPRRAVAEPALPVAVEDSPVLEPEPREPERETRRADAPHAAQRPAAASRPTPAAEIIAPALRSEPTADAQPVRPPRASAAPAPAAARPAPARRAEALSAAWIETPAPRPRAPQGLAAAPAAPPRAATKHLIEPVDAPSTKTAPATVPPQPARTPVRPAIVAPVAVQSAPRHPGPQRAAAPAPAPAPSRELVIDQLDVRIVTEPPPRAATLPAPHARAPAALGAWRPSARRFLRQP